MRPRAFAIDVFQTDIKNMKNVENNKTTNKLRASIVHFTLLSFSEFYVLPQKWHTEKGRKRETTERATE